MREQKRSQGVRTVWLTLGLFTLTAYDVSTASPLVLRFHNSMSSPGLTHLLEISYTSQCRTHRTMKSRSQLA